MNNRSSRTGLFLMELILSIFFFCLAAAVCVQMFVMSHTLSSNSNKLNIAITSCQSMAEAFYATDGDLSKLATLMDGISLSDSKVTQEKEDGFKVEGTLVKEGDLLSLTIEYIDTVKDEVVYSLNPKLFPKGGNE